MKTCTKCNLPKEDSAFYFDKRRNSYRRNCKECTKLSGRLANKEWRTNNPERRKKSDFKSKLKANYGLSPEELLIIWENQNRSCAICHRPISLSASEKSSKPHVDHCHVTKVVRGLLCLTCNTGLGMFGDSVDLLDSAKLYLRTRGVPTLKDTLPVTASVSADNIPVTKH